MANGCPVRVDGQLYQITKAIFEPGVVLPLRIEMRLYGSRVARFQDRYLTITACFPQPTAQPKLAKFGAHPTPQTAFHIDGQLALHDVPTLLQ